MFLKQLIVLLVASVVSALDGLYYQVYTDTDVSQHMQHRLSCVTAIFDDISTSRGFYVFNGYDVAQQQISKYKGQLLPSYKNRNCYDMRPVHGGNVSANMTQKICLFPVDSTGDYVVVTNGNFKRTFVLTRFQPDHHSPSLDDPEFAMVNETIATYGLPNDLVRTNHSSCFFYPPKSLGPFKKSTKGAPPR